MFEMQFYPQLLHESLHSLNESETLFQLVAVVNILLLAIAQFAPHFVLQNTLILQQLPATYELYHLAAGRKSLTLKTITLIRSVKFSVLDL